MSLPGITTLVLVLSLPLSASTAAAPCRKVEQRTSEEFAVTGPYPVGVETFTFVDTSRSTPPNGDFPGAPERTLVTEVWYPATTAGRGTPVDIAGGPYPIVVHSHGFLDNRLGESYVTEHLASRGYVVAAVDYPLSNGAAPGGATVADVHNQAGDWSFVLDRVLVELAAVVDPAWIGASGLSLGGLTTFLVTFHANLRDPRIRAALPMAPPGCIFTRRFFDTTPTPLLVLHGDSDQLVPFRENARRAFGRADRPKYLVKLKEGSHTGFSAFAVYLDQGQHFDGLGCAALLAGLGDGANDPNVNPFEPLGGGDVGVDLNPRHCPSVCEDEIPEGPSMGAIRHHELTRTVAAAFFDAYLRGDDSARCFLRRTLRQENRDLLVRSRASLRPGPLSGP
jgi:predicted dienelactone hydrolase